MNTELSPEITRTCSKTHGRLQTITVSDFEEINQVAMFRAIKQHVTETYHGKQRHGMLLLNA